MRRRSGLLHHVGYFVSPANPFLSRPSLTIARNDPFRLARWAGAYKGVQSGGAAISFGMDAVKVGSHFHPATILPLLSAGHNYRILTGPSNCFSNPIILPTVIPLHHRRCTNRLIRPPSSPSTSSHGCSCSSPSRSAFSSSGRPLRPTTTSSASSASRMCGRGRWRGRPCQLVTMRLRGLRATTRGTMWLDLVMILSL